MAMTKRRPGRSNPPIYSFAVWPMEMRAETAAACVDEPSVEAFWAKVRRGIAKEQYGAFRAHVLDFMKREGSAFLTVRPDGSASITAKRPDAAPVKPTPAVAAAESIRSAGRAVKAAADGLVLPKPEADHQPTDFEKWQAKRREAGTQGPRLPDAAKPNEAPAAAMRGLPPLNPAGFDPNRIDPHDLMKPAAPLGANSVTNSTANDNRAVHQTFNVNTTIHEARNVREAGRVMEGTFGRMHGIALENAQSAIA